MTEPAESQLLNRPKLHAVGIIGIPVEDVKSLLKIFFETASTDISNLEFDTTPLGFFERYTTKLLDELENLERLARPTSTWKPEWYDPEVQTRYDALIERSEFHEEFRDYLSESFQLSIPVADGLRDIMAEMIRKYGVEIYSYYQIDENI